VVQAYGAGRFRLGEDGRVAWHDPWFSADEFSMQGQQA